MPRSTLTTIYKVFRLIQLLSSPPYLKVPQLAERLDCAPRTVYDYLKLLERLGFEPDSDKYDRYSIPLERERTATGALNLVNARYLHDALWQLPDSEQRSQLLLWLNEQYALGPVVESLTQYTPSRHREQLLRALDKGHRVRLYNYRGSQGALRHRYVEPVAFQQDYTYIYCFDLEVDVTEEDPGYRQFKLTRIGRVDVLEDEPIEGDHAAYVPDVFGWTGMGWKNVRLELGPQAKQLLLEEYPAARPFVAEVRGGKFVADLNVRGFTAVGRWVMGLAHDVRVLPGGDGADFGDWLNGRWRRF